jgi:predicted aspartyl protease
LIGADFLVKARDHRFESLRALFNVELHTIVVPVSPKPQIAACFVFALCYSNIGRADVKFGFTQAVRTNGNHLFIPVTVNHSAPTWWLVDTGAPVSLIDTEYARQLGLSAAPGAEGSSSTTVNRERSGRPSVVCQDLQIGTMDCGGVILREVSVESLAGEKNISWHGSFNKTGIIGLNLLAKYGALINCRLGQLFFSPTGNLGLSAAKYEQQGFTSVPLTVTRTNRLEINGTLGGQTYSFIIDTGSPFCLFNDRIRNKAHVPFWQTNVSVRAPFANFNGAKISLAPLSDFKVGGYDARGAYVGFAAFPINEPGLEHPFAGLIGADFLGYRSAIIDIGGRMLYLKPSRGAG